jgi:hypothetical protein
VMKIQYEKLSNDWRSFNNLIWAVPTVAVAIMSGMLIAAYREEFNVIPQVRIAILGLGSLFLFALTIEVIKKRFHMNVITYLLQDIEAEGFALEKKFRFPLGTKGIDEYIEGKSKGDPKKKPDDYSDPVFKFFKMSYARKYLTYVILIAAISLALLAEWEFIKFGEYHIWFYIVGIVVVIAPVIATIAYYVIYVYIPNYVYYNMLPHSKLVITFTLKQANNNHNTLVTDEWRLDTGKPTFLKQLASIKVKSAAAKNLQKLKQLLETGKVTLQDGRTAVA